MADISFSDVKVHNEVEFCSVVDFGVKKQLERLFLENRISYFEKWNDTGFIKKMFLGETKEKCILCINEMQKEKALEILSEHPELKAGIEMIDKRVSRTFF